jgi:hypothetical protein
MVPTGKNPEGVENSTVGRDVVTGALAGLLLQKHRSNPAPSMP